MVKLHITLKITTSNNKLLFWMFFCVCKQKISEHYINTLNIAENHKIWLTKKVITSFCVIYQTKVIEAINFFLSLADI